jgi:GNAT superfamily N-acetyltransferase
MATFRSVRIDRARHADVPALSELLAELFAIESDFAPDREKQRRGLELLLQQPENRVQLLVARSDAAAVLGMASAQLVISTAEGALSAWIEDLVVRETFRGQGIARLLVKELLLWAQAQGATRAQLLADRANIPALDFYRHTGWQSTQLSTWRRSLEDH